MAKKFQKKAIKKKDNRGLITIGVFVVAITMLLSGFFYFSSDETNPEIRNGNQPEPLIEKYQINQIGNSSIIARINNVTSDIIVMPDARCVYFETISEIQNISAENIKVAVEVADPTIILQQAPIICGFYKLFKFSMYESNNSIDLREIKQKLGKFSVLHGYMADLPVSISGTDKVYVVGQPENNAGDYLRIVLYQKISNGLGSGMIGFEERKVPVGPVLSATVVNITDIILQGTINTDFPTDLKEKINATELNLLPLKVLINKIINNKTAEEMNNLKGVGVFINPEENRTEISFNNSKEDIIEILANEKINYSLQNGEVISKIPLNSDIEHVSDILADNNVQDVKFGKEGIVSLPREFMLENKPVPIMNSDRFSAILEMERKIGDRTNVSVNTMRFGEQIIAFSASEVR